MAFEDHFSKQAEDYARYRPAYPEGLYRYALGLTPPCPCIWDIGCGNGQAATALAGLAPGSRVIATDPSERQLAQAPRDPRVTYRAEPAERTSIADGAVDLAVSAQAAHWFDHEAFAAEARRVIKPGGALIFWCYGLCRVEATIDEALGALYQGRLGAYWPAGRAFIDAGYKTLPFPFTELDPPDFAIETDWDRDHFLGYIGTWSAVQRCRHREGVDPVAELARDLAPSWPRSAVKRVRWPIHMRVGRR